MARGSHWLPAGGRLHARVKATGYLNFRMRAMVVSFASHDLWLDWRETGLVLARWFTDFEPGIHWSQMQMQSGVNGNSTLRIYNPTTQATQHDPQASSSVTGFQSCAVCQIRLCMRRG